MEYISEEAKDTAKKIRKRLKREFPEYPASHFKVKTSLYSMGSSITVTWTDNPTYKDVNDIVSQYKSRVFDGMTDYESVVGYVDEDGQTYVGAGYIFSDFNISDARRKVTDKWIAELVKENPSYYDFYQNRRNYVEVVDYFDRNHELKPEYLSDNLEKDIDLVGMRENILKETLDKLQVSNFRFPVMGIYRVGEIIETDESVTYFKLTHARTRSQLMDEIYAKYPIEKLEWERKVAQHPNQLEKNLRQGIHAAIRDSKVLEDFSTMLTKDLHTLYTRQVRSKYPILSDLYKEKGDSVCVEWNQYIHINDFKEMQEVLNLHVCYIVKDVDVSIREAVDNSFEDFLESKKETADIQDIVINQIKNEFMNLSPEDRQRYVKIVNKNNGEILVRMEHSGLAVKGANTEGLPVVKYAVDNEGNLIFYQTAFGLWVAMKSPVNGEYVKQTLYKISSHTIADSVTIAKGLQKKFNLPHLVTTIAENMYLRK